MKTTPLLMTGGNVRAILEDRKTNTRRVCVARTQNEADIIAAAIMDDMQGADDGRHEKAAWERIGSPYGKPGDILALKETWWGWGFWFPSVIDGKTSWTWIDRTDATHRVLYDADYISEPVDKASSRGELGYHKRPSIYLPKEAWRIRLEITRMEVQRLQDISESDAKAEGCDSGDFTKITDPRTRDIIDWPMMDDARPFANTYSLLWDSINGKPRPGKPNISWNANPYVWSLHFRKLT